MAAYYNEIEPYAAEWLRKLIAAGHIAPGDVDERSIVNVPPDDLKGYTQCHFFAGIGVWSYALRRSGWPDDRPVWTGSCPCQPFSAAGKGNGFDDQRHLWPFWFYLINQCQPANIFGEQVASQDGLSWLDLVQSDLEGANYACWPIDLCAAGIGAPHIRQRLWFVAEHAGSLANAEMSKCEQPDTESQVRKGFADSCTICVLGDSEQQGLERHCRNGNAEAGWKKQARSIAKTGAPCRMAVTNHDKHFEEIKRSAGNSQTTAPCNGQNINISRQSGRTNRGLHICHEYNSANGYWRDCDWLFCSDGKWRPVESGTFPLAHGIAARVGRLRAYGNAIVPQVAEAIISTYLDFRL